MKCVRIEKTVTKLLLFTDGMFKYVASPTKFTDKLIEPIKKYSKFTRSNFKYRNVLYLYISANE